MELDAPPLAPTLWTPRLRIRPAGEEDLDLLVCLWNDPAVGRYLWDGEAVPRETARAVLRASRTTFQADRYGLWVVCLGDRAIGCCGLRPSAVAGEVELLYALEPAAWGRGLASEAAAAVLRHALDTLRLPRVTATADPDNAASWRVLEKIGLRRIARTRTDAGELLVYSS